MVEIRTATAADRDAIWDIFREVVAARDTYAFDPGMSHQDALGYWFQANTRTYVAESSGRIFGTYILRPNQSGGGSHVANAGFMVAPDARGRGIGRAMAEHCLSEARRLGFRAMQFNFVVSTNDPAVRLWQKLGFKIVGTLPGAFHHPEEGYVDVYVMFRSLL
jgi:ribosomal protein S18 acetylase RimI-like enzyme